MLPYKDAGVVQRVRPGRAVVVIDSQNRRGLRAQRGTETIAETDRESLTAFSERVIDNRDRNCFGAFTSRKLHSTEGV